MAMRNEGMGDRVLKIMDRVVRGGGAHNPQAWETQDVPDLATPVQISKEQERRMLAEAEASARTGAYGGHIGGTYGGQMHTEFEIDGGTLGAGITLIDLPKAQGNFQGSAHGSGFFAWSGGDGISQVQSTNPDGSPGNWIAVGNANNSSAALGMMGGGVEYVSDLGVTLPAILSPWGKDGPVDYVIAMGDIVLGSDGQISVAFGGGYATGAEAMVQSPYGDAVARPDLPDEGHGDLDSYAAHGAGGINFAGGFKYNVKGPDGFLGVRVQRREKTGQDTYRDLPPEWIGLGIDTGRWKGALDEDRIIDVNGGLAGGYSGAGIRTGTGSVKAGIGQLAITASGIRPSAHLLGGQGEFNLNFGIDITGPNIGLVRTNNYGERFRDMIMTKHPVTGKSVPIFGWAGSSLRAVAQISQSIAGSAGFASAMYNPKMAEALMKAGYSNEQVLANLREASVSIRTPYCIVQSSSTPKRSIFQ